MCPRYGVHVGHGGGSQQDLIKDRKDPPGGKLGRFVHPKTSGSGMMIGAGTAGQTGADPGPGPTRADLQVAP